MQQPPSDVSDGPSEEEGSQLILGFIKQIHTIMHVYETNPNLDLGDKQSGAEFIGSLKFYLSYFQAPGSNPRAFLKRYPPDNELNTVVGRLRPELFFGKDDRFLPFAQRLARRRGEIIAEHTAMVENGITLPPFDPGAPSHFKLPQMEPVVSGLQPAPPGAFGASALSFNARTGSPLPTTAASAGPSVPATSAVSGPPASFHSFLTAGLPFPGDHRSGE
ncbi:hypothetical protein QFC20_007259 [Naganishia adeliensis]|uniref:Uncharacterized protein n=1 Tax=Naganishia adeliensis TaxID=92952 RepID=A0ACC2V2E7_9TREE|nr:hypothetical protein QFC20_007259 [Naganishia adeliensis]